MLSMKSGVLHLSPKMLSAVWVQGPAPALGARSALPAPSVDLPCLGSADLSSCS